MSSTDPAPGPAPDPRYPPANGVPLGDDRAMALRRVLSELEIHVSQAGWDGPIRLFALIRTAGALHRDPSLATALPPDVVAAARADPEHLTAVEQEDVPDVDTLSELLGGIAWPDSVDGAAIVVERLVLPPEAESDLPEDPLEAEQALAGHPDRREVRMAAGVLRDGHRACALRTRDHDDDLRVAMGPDLVPGLTSALSATLED